MKRARIALQYPAEPSMQLLHTGLYPHLAYISHEPTHLLSMQLPAASARHYILGFASVARAAKPRFFQASLAMSSHSNLELLLAAQNSDATNHANIVTIGAYGATASVQPLTGMHYPRAYCTSVVLPDGKVLTMGGQVISEQCL